MILAQLCTVVVLLAVPSHEQGSQGSTLTSPCPHVFLYDPPGSLQPGLWSGIVTLTTDMLLHSTWLTIGLDSQATMLKSWLGNVTQYGLEFVIENDEMLIHPGQPVLVPFFIQYDPLNTIPRLREIRLNGKVICNAVTQQRGTVGKPVIWDPEIRTNLDGKRVPTSPSKSKFNAEHRYSNTSATSEMVECGVVSGANEGVTLSFKKFEYARGDLPWIVAIYRNLDAGGIGYLCQGTLVSNRHVVTTATCIFYAHDFSSLETLIVKLGVHNLEDWSDDDIVTRNIDKVFLHEDFRLNTTTNTDKTIHDILMFTLAKPVKFSQYIRPACLWTGDTALSRVVGATGVLASWGVESMEDDTILKENIPYVVLVPIVSTSYCRATNARLRGITSDTTLCAGARNGVGPCKGSLGSGLYLLEGGRWRLRGIVSFVPAIDMKLEPDRTILRTCSFDEFGVYTDTAQYLTWMRNILSSK